MGVGVDVDQRRRRGVVLGSGAGHGGAAVLGSHGAAASRVLLLAVRRLPACLALF
jgi:hypothetical protein